MSSTLLPSAEWISASSRRRAATALAQDRNNGSGGCCPPGAGHPTGIPPQPGSNDDDAHREERFVGHRGSGGLVHGRAVFCLPPGVEWFQGHFAYAARGGCTASLGVLGTELPVDPCMQCCHGGFSRYKLVFIHHESGKESALVVERYGGNMMTLNAEPSAVMGGGDGPVPPESELSFTTHVMKASADDDARTLLGRYFQSIVRASSDPSELQDCIVCIGAMDVPLSLLQELAAPLPDSRTQSMVCSAFAPCRETPQQDQSPPRQQQQQQQQLQQQQGHPLPGQHQRRRRTGERNKHTPVLSPYPSGREEQAHRQAAAPPPPPPSQTQAPSRDTAAPSPPSTCCTSGGGVIEEGNAASRSGGGDGGESSSAGGGGGRTSFGDGTDRCASERKSQVGAAAAGAGATRNQAEKEDDDWLEG
ncbi:unnamed protein product [Ectocarpus sp. 6 AP-2014]